jgi:Right handed beta helix region
MKVGAPVITGDAPVTRRQMMRGTLGALLAGTLGLPACTRSDAQGCRPEWACVTDERFSGGARGDGANDDTAAINSAIQQAAGGTVYLPLGDYLVNPVSAEGVALRLDRPATRLVLDSGAVIRMGANTLSHYAMVQVTAPDCVIEGGKWIGDLETHTGTTGEWGHCIDIRHGGDRSVVRNTSVSNAWGDGMYISGHPADVSIENVIADGNRRQGLTINDALRPRVIGGIYRNSGSISYIDPAGGIVVEPNRGTERTVVDAILQGVLFSGNRGVGFWASSNDRPLSCTLDRCRAVQTADGSGFMVSGSNNSTRFDACESIDNNGTGFLVEEDADSTQIAGCIARGNAHAGFLTAGSGTNLNGCRATSNGRPGYYLDPQGNGLVMTDCMSISNVRSVPDGVEVDVYAPGTRLTSVVADAGVVDPVAAYGIAVRPSAKGCILRNCSVRGTFRSGPWIDLAGGTEAIPNPGD